MLYFSRSLSARRCATGTLKLKTRNFFSQNRLLNIAKTALAYAKGNELRFSNAIFSIYTPTFQDYAECILKNA
jgi:hypothetical protein